MNQADRIEYWNRLFDDLPEGWRFQVILWPLLIIGAFNMALTIAVGFPFGLLVVIAILIAGGIRLPYACGWIHHEADAPPGSSRTFRLGRIDWIWQVNAWYEAQPFLLRFCIVPAVLILAGTINMILTLAVRFPFGLLFLLALLAIICIRGPFAAGWLLPPEAASTGPAVPAGDVKLLNHETPPAQTELHIIPPTIEQAQPAGAAVESP